VDVNDGADHDAARHRWCVVRLGNDGRPAVGSVGHDGVVLVVAVTAAYAQLLIEGLVADANAGRGPRELADRAERARESLRVGVAELLDDAEAIDRLDDVRAIEISKIKHAHGAEAAAAAVTNGPDGGEHGGRPGTPLADVVAALEREGMPATMVSRWLAAPHDDLDEGHADPPATPAVAIAAGRVEEVADLVARMVAAGTVPGAWTTCSVCMRPARWARTGGLGAVDIVCDVHRQELGDRDADWWQPERGYDGRQGDEP
jgi:hypothetical protein